MSAALPKTLSCDVAIVGYGPVGNVLAALLAQRHMSVVVLERFPTRYDKPRAATVDGETMRTFQNLGLGDEFLKITRPSLRYNLVDSKHNPLATIEQGETGSGWPVTSFFHQPQMEDLLHRRVEQLGVRVFMNVTVEDVTQDADSVTVHAQTSHDVEGSKKHKIEAKFAIGCDGAGSAVRKLIGSTKRDLGFPAIDNLVIDFEHDDPDIEIESLDEIYQVLDIKRPHMAARWIGPRWTRWEFARNEGETREWLESEETAWKLISPWNITSKNGTIKRRAIYIFESSMTTKWREGRILLAGDAAHTMPPFMGQGWCSGVRDSVNLSWKLDAILKGKADVALLDTYQPERERHVLRLIEMSAAIGRGVLATDPAQAEARDAKLRAGIVPTAGALPRLEGGIVRRPGHANACAADGRLSRQGRVLYQDRINRLDDIISPVWKVISRRPVDQSLFSAKQRSLLTSLDLQFVHISRGSSTFVDIDGDYSRWYFENDRKAFLIRPDNYVFGTVKSNAELPALLDDLEEVLLASGWQCTTDAVAMVLKPIPDRIKFQHGQCE